MYSLLLHLKGLLVQIPIALCISVPGDFINLSNSADSNEMSLYLESYLGILFAKVPGTCIGILNQKCHLIKHM